MDFADADAVKPDDRPGGVESRMRDLTEPFRLQAAHRVLAMPRPPAQPRREHEPSGQIDQIEHIRRQGGILSRNAACGPVLATCQAIARRQVSARPQENQKDEGIAFPYSCKAELSIPPSYHHHAVGSTISSWRLPFSSSPC